MCIRDSDRAALDAKLQELMNELEEDSAAKTGMTLNIAVNYGGRPEICLLYTSRCV